MKRSLIVILCLLFSFQSFARTCADEFRSYKRESYFNRLSDDTQRGITAVSTFGGLIVGISVAGATFPGFLLIAGIAASPILVGDAIKGIQNRPLNRMIRLIKQSDKLLANPESKAGGLLKRVHKRLQKSKLNNISILELAASISAANKDLTKCGSIYGVKNIDDNVKSGKLEVIDLDQEEAL